MNIGPVAIGIVLIIVILAIILIVCYNTLIAKKQGVKNAWAQIEVQLNRRYDLIPNLVEVAKKYMAHEADTLTKIVEARSKAMSSSGPSDSMAANNVLSGALANLFAVAESYPDLRSSENMIQLQQELSSTESKIAFARDFYNSAVMQLNTAIEQFPTNLMAGAAKATPAAFFEIDDPAASEPVKVRFD